MPRRSKAQATTDAAMAALRSSILEYGFEDVSEIEDGLFLQPGPPGAWLGRKGLLLQGYAADPGSGDPPFVGRVQIVIHSPSLSALTFSLLGFGERSPVVAIDLGALELGRPGEVDHRPLYSKEDAEGLAVHTMQRIRDYSETFYRRFETRQSTFEHFLDRGNGAFRLNLITGILLSLDDGDVSSANTFAAAFEQIWPVGTDNKVYRMTEGHIAAIESHYSVTLPFPRA